MTLVIGSYSVNSDDPYSEIANRVPVIANCPTTGAPYLMSLLSSSARSSLEAQLGPHGCHVDPVFQHSRPHYVGFISDVVKAGSVGFVEDAVEHVGLFIRCQEGWGSGNHS